MIRKLTFEAERVTSSAEPRVIGRIVKRMRLAAGMDHKQLAAEIGLSRSSLVNIEGGKHVISLAKLIKAAEATGHTISIVVVDKEKK